MTRRRSTKFTGWRYVKLIHEVLRFKRVKRKGSRSIFVRFTINSDLSDSDDAIESKSSYNPILRAPPFLFQESASSQTHTALSVLLLQYDSSTLHNTHADQALPSCSQPVDIYERILYHLVADRTSIKSVSGTISRTQGV